MGQTHASKNRRISVLSYPKKPKTSSGEWKFYLGQLTNLACELGLKTKTSSEQSQLVESTRQKAAAWKTAPFFQFLRPYRRQKIWYVVTQAEDYLKAVRLTLHPCAAAANVMKRAFLGIWHGQRQVNNKASNPLPRCSHTHIHEFISPQPLFFRRVPQWRMRLGMLSGVLWIRLIP